MTLTYRDGIAILELAAYPPLLACAIYLFWKFGFKTASVCWRFVVVLCLLRIIGASCTLALINSYSITLVRTAAVCDLIGISPLTLTCIGLLSYANIASLIVPNRFFKIMTIISIVGLVIGIVGISESSNSATKVAMAIFLFVFAAVVACLLHMASGWKRLQTRDQKNAIRAVAISVPLILVRLAYSAIADFGSGNKNIIKYFGVLSGNPTIYLCMSVLEEIIVTGICIGFGLTFSVNGFSAVPPAEDLVYLGGNGQVDYQNGNPSLEMKGRS